MDGSIADWISRLGFPIAVAAYVLIRLNGSLASLREEVTKLRVALAERVIVVRDADDHQPITISPSALLPPHD